MIEPKWLEWAKELQSIAQTGLAYTNDVYDQERFQGIREISVKILEHYTELDKQKIKDLFANETGYATPKVDIRAVVFKDNQILMVREKSDGAWALPGGWADIGLAPSEVAVKEVKEESGFDVRAVKLLAVLDKKCHPHPPSSSYVYKMLIQCEIIGGNPRGSIETSAVQFFSEDNLPPLSTARNTKSQIKLAFKYLKNPQEPVYFD
jgi:ADP-ribose pyrophosphatase YjhB (NUDIX family)